MGSLISGLAAYAFIAIGTRTVGSGAFAPVSVLWTIWAMSAAVLTFPVQHWVIRTVEANSGEDVVRRALKSLFAAGALLGILFGVVTWFARENLFLDADPLFPVLTALVPIGSVFMGVNRGVLSARLRFRSTALAIAFENLIRAAAAVAATTPAGLGWALVGGFTVGFFWPSSLRLQPSGSSRDETSPFAFIGGVAGGSLIGQIVLTSGPVILALIGGAPSQVTALFSALALFRAPYMIAIGVTPRLTAWLTRTVLDRGVSALRRMTGRILATAFVASGAAALLGVTIGPRLLTLIFGPDVVLERTAIAMVAVGSAVAICTLFLTLMMVAAARASAITTAWSVAAASGILFLAIGTASPVITVAGAFLVAEVVALVAISVAATRRRRGASAPSG